MKHRRKKVAIRLRPVDSRIRLKIDIASRTITRKSPKYGSIGKWKPLDYSLKKRDCEKTIWLDG